MTQKRIINYITQLVITTELDIDEVLEQAIEKFSNQFDEEEIIESFNQAMEEIPDLN